MRSRTRRGLPALIALVASTACSVDLEPSVEHDESVASPIIGGEVTAPGAFPAVVAVRIGSGLCTGSLVAPTIVLTAAHCLDLSLNSYPDQAALTTDTTVVFDATDIFASGTPVAAVATIPHPLFDINILDGTHDFGIVVLATPVIDRAPLVYSRDATLAPPGSIVAVVGYGVDETQDIGIEHDVPDKATTSCQMFGLSDALSLCFDQTDNRGSCGGDSGGPAIFDDGGVPTLVGVTSFGNVDCDILGVYGRPEGDLAFLDAWGCPADGFCVESCGANGLPVDPDCPVGTGGGGGATTGASSGGGGSGGASVGSVTSQASSGAGGSGGAGTTSRDQPADSGGCGCRTTSGSDGGRTLIALALGVALGSSRRRAARRQRAPG